MFLNFCSWLFLSFAIVFLLPSFFQYVNGLIIKETCLKVFKGILWGKKSHFLVLLNSDYLYWHILIIFSPSEQMVKNTCNFSIPFCLFCLVLVFVSINPSACDSLNCQNLKFLILLISESFEYTIVNNTISL